ncbi:hypothetical protein NC652_035694 [Populus alba x Populus x berolinensis]|uniref:Uncharacterized protein n=1 Tax=Populus alba x Populus x berolinensis TaxID=444605 RepID=A0AAD6LSC1_9ROSI|nr:hypothetical protein NC652_035164 [Populus alba x Populus x berolinensis]KAJ6876399.1 hypothetical protein NC652_035694 [Populus alba x Populus x berolinensis]KAJ6970847.1 hypothetical protein NC653_035197 [Populus alba x Populus x berolinensis]
MKTTRPQQKWNNSKRDKALHKKSANVFGFGENNTNKSKKSIDGVAVAGFLPASFTNQASIPLETWKLPPL